MVSHGNGRIRSGGEGVMALNKEQVLAALEGVASPTGTPLPRTGALSDVVAGDGKVFFSITVDAADVKAW
jgi:ATP-binding protein involved in chromosome partitioning